MSETAWTIVNVDAARLCMEGDIQRREAELAADLAHRPTGCGDPTAQVKGRTKVKHRADYPTPLCWLEGPTGRDTYPCST